LSDFNGAVFKPGLEGVVAFETEIAEPDKAGGSLRYRGVDIEDLIGTVSFGDVWGLLVDGKFGPGLPPAEPFPVPVHSGDIRVDVQSAVAMLAPYWGLSQLLDIDDEQVRRDLARVSVTALSFVAQAARGLGLPAVPQKDIDKAQTIGIGENGPEAVIPLNARGADFMTEVMGSVMGGRNMTAGGGSMNVYNTRVDRSTNFTGPITVQASNPQELLQKLQARQRVMALSRPALTGSHRWLRRHPRS